MGRKIGLCRGSWFVKRCWVKHTPPPPPQPGRQTGGLRALIANRSVVFIRLRYPQHDKFLPPCLGGGKRCKTPRKNTRHKKNPWSGGKICTGPHIFPPHPYQACYIFIKNEYKCKALLRIEGVMPTEGWLCSVRSGRTITSIKRGDSVTPHTIKVINETSVLLLVVRFPVCVAVVYV